ncbi:MAG: hypothetical protein OXC91_04840 [Rhodobacteraceae bacterium]|nr:hypothetical protein [Paracoccaceae bacterium]
MTIRLGDVRAEEDAEMLKQAFVETDDYRTLIERNERCIVVGRRGTGKSALALKLAERQEEEQNAILITIAGDEEENIGIEEKIQKFGNSYGRQKAAAKLVWLYAIWMEILQQVRDRGNDGRKGRKMRKERVSKWVQGRKSIGKRVWEVLREETERQKIAEIGELDRQLDIRKIGEEVGEILENENRTVYIIVDRLDEGWEVSESGIAAVNGLVQGIIETRVRIKRVVPIVFIRDNMYRGIQEMDPDFCRNIEGQVLRLYWSNQKLWEVIVERLRIAKSGRQEATEKIWNQCVEEELMGREGFTKYLKRTLYRPRDILGLIQATLEMAEKSGRSKINLKYIQLSAKEISNNRLLDLFKEYTAMLPLLPTYTEVWRNSNVQRKAEIIKEEIQDRLDKTTATSQERQEWLVLKEDTSSALKQQYGVGLVGIQDRRTGAYSFCQDGRPRMEEIRDDDKIMLHPAYWHGLNANGTELEVGTSQDIYDEYEIERQSDAPVLRQRMLRERRNALTEIVIGVDGAANLEEWCVEVIQICFAKSLRNVERQPVSTGTNRPDIVARNLGISEFWGRVLNDYHSRQVVFEVKNKDDFDSNDIRQLAAYLTNGAGSIGFLVTRGGTENLERGAELDQIRDAWTNERKLILKIPCALLSKLLGRLEQTSRHDKVDNFLNSLLDRYERCYIKGQLPAGRKMTCARKSNRKRKRF